MNDSNVAIVFVMTCLIAVMSFMCICLRMEAKKLTKIAKNYKDYYEKTRKEIALAKIDLLEVACRAEAILNVLDEAKNDMEESKNDELSSGEKNLDK